MKVFVKTTENIQKRLYSDLNVTAMFSTSMNPSKARTVAATLWAAVGGKTIKVVTAFLMKLEHLYET